MISDDDITNPALYIKQESRTAYLINRPDNRTSQEIKTTSPRTFCNEFQDMNQIIEVNVCSLLVERQLNKDRIYGTMSLTNKHNMNVIIREKDIHSDLI